MKWMATEAERREFEQDFREGRPIKPKASSRPAKKSASSGGGLDGGTQDRLDRGKLPPEARLDLHGLTQAAAHHSLAAFLHDAREQGLRLVVIVTGKGNPQAADVAAWTASPHGVLRQMVPRWLGEKPLSAMIARMQPAHARHGGDGALYVYLRKS